MCNKRKPEEHPDAPNTKRPCVKDRIAKLEQEIEDIKKELLTAPELVASKLTAKSVLEKVREDEEKVASWWISTIKEQVDKYPRSKVGPYAVVGGPSYCRWSCDDLDVFTWGRRNNIISPYETHATFKNKLRHDGNIKKIMEKSLSEFTTVNASGTILTVSMNI